MSTERTSPRVGVFIQARSNSSRLPGKIYAGLPNEQSESVLEHIYRRLSTMSRAAIVVLVPDSDAFLQQWCRSRGMTVFAGPEDDVRERYRRAATHFGVDVIVRATGDNPCVDPEIAVDTVRELMHRNVDLLSFGNLPLGVAVEAMTVDALMSDRAHTDGTVPPIHREHVSLHIKHHPEQYSIEHPEHPVIEQVLGVASPGAEHLPRLTVDTPEDLTVVRQLYRELGGRFRLRQILHLFRARPEMFVGNRRIVQRSFAPVRSVS